MRAVIVRQPGDESVLALGEVPAPLLGPADVRIRVATAAVNRADLLQRQGLYPPPPGVTDVLGLECAGEVIEIGADVRDVAVDTRVMALLPGGGYAEEVAVDHGSVMPVPDALTDEEAAGVPEVFLTAFANLFLPRLGALQAGESALVHGGGGGVGTAAIVLLRETGNPCFVTVGSAEKGRRCEALGASLALDYTAGDFADAVRARTDGRGVDVVLDHVGATYLEPNLRALAVGGRLVVIGLMGGGTFAELDLGALLLRRQSVIGSTLRSRPTAEKSDVVRAFLDRFGAALRAGRLRPPIDAVLPLADVAEAHRRMQASAHFGKIVLRVR
ncbi:MAG: NAD(P)H-quinone oxidoreductase [bacterium]|nr:NAD(P)H-quinone oxidoreductase [bacterium]